ncbi:MAG: GDSL-type esterase/lipase family protein [Actinomycetota bacterium]
MTSPRRFRPHVRAAAVAVVAACAVAGCALVEADDDVLVVNDDVPPPLPTIGLGSDTGEGGVISGSAEVRAIDTGEIESLVMIGDSITVGSQPSLQELFTTLGFDDVAIVAQTSKRTAVGSSDNPSGVVLADFLDGEDDLAADQRLWVVALGTNDVGQYDGVEPMEDAVRELLDEIPEDAPVVWINAYFRDRPDGTAEVNAAIENVLTERGNAALGRWDLVAPGDGVLRSDGVHPNQEGAVIFADLVARTVVDFVG